MLHSCTASHIYSGVNPSKLHFRYTYVGCAVHLLLLFLKTQENWYYKFPGQVAFQQNALSLFHMQCFKYLKTSITPPLTSSSSSSSFLEQFTGHSKYKSIICLADILCKEQTENNQCLFQSFNNICHYARGYPDCTRAHSNELCELMMFFCQAKVSLIYSLSKHAWKSYKVFCYINNIISAHKSQHPSHMGKGWSSESWCGTVAWSWKSGSPQFEFYLCHELTNQPLVNYSLTALNHLSAIGGQ